MKVELNENDEAIGVTGQEEEVETKSRMIKTQMALEI